MNTNLKNTLMAISELKSEDIVSVINAVRNRQKELNTIAGAAARMMFTVGAKVRVNGSRETFLGTIEKINRTRCIVKKESTGQSYRVPMSMLKEVA
ncbi:MAG: hypothetical protein CMC41_01830 [Flavobacteriaceae bacterium]|nr:hypothetical protein [Flavobacteriaceae bacterium]OUW64124.1 MAG: hypothetical protein CBD61_00530 [Pelagibacteraceae bacterium TMED201]|tara:strand:- start:355 stop:642 length:288 start_codon:yes stop_codon:yes gene_type:complete